MIYQNLIINKNIWSKLEAMFHANKIPHALLFHGPSGIGKEGHAIELASLLNYKTKADLEKIKIFQIQTTIKFGCYGQAATRSQRNIDRLHIARPDEFG